MAKRVIFLVGKQGSGKTSLACALASQNARRQPAIVCAVVLNDCVLRFDAAVPGFGDKHEPSLLDDADLLLMERLPEQFDPSMTRPGDQVIHLERISRQLTAEQAAVFA